MKASKNLKEGLIKTLEKRHKTLHANLKRLTEGYNEEKGSILTKIEVVELQLKGLKGK